MRVRAGRHTWGMAPLVGFSGIVLIVLALVSMIGITLIEQSTKTYITATYKGYERIVTSEDSYYVVFTDIEVFRNTDYLLTGKFNSSDIIRVLEQGKTYQFEVVGWRIPFLSSYRNILSVRELQ